MVKTFVAINDWCHKLLRETTRRTPLTPVKLADGTTALRYRVRRELLPESYFAVAGCHTLDGLPLEQVGAGCWKIRAGCEAEVIEAAGGFDATRLDRRCWGDLRLKRAADLQEMLSGELLTFGAGMLRCGSPAGPDGRISTKLENVFSRIWALRARPISGDGQVDKNTFDSTNVIYGDAFGELEQLWDRRADIALLDAAARNLQLFREWRGLPCSGRPPLNSSAVLQIHIRSQAMWRTPPRDGRALLRRLELILEHTILDSSATTSRAGKTAPPCFERPRTPRRLPRSGPASN